MASGPKKRKFPFPEAPASAILQAAQRNLANSSPLAIPEKSIDKPRLLPCFFLLLLITYMS